MAYPKLPSELGRYPRKSRVVDTSGPLLLEHLSDEEGWAVLTERGKKINPFIRTAAALAYYLCRERLTERITNLDILSELLQRIARGEYKSPLYS